jgi:hypothetical protein
MRGRNAALLLGLVAVVGLMSWLLVGRSRPLPGAPLARVPATATATLWIDTGAVLGSPWWARVVEARGGDEGIRRIERTCGFDPLAQLTDVTAFATGETPDRLDHVGVVARGTLDHEQLARCVAKVVAEEGGEVRRVSIEGVPAVAGRGSSRAAFVGTDGVVAGSEPLVREVVRVVAGDARAASADETSSRMWDRVAGGRHVVLVGRVPGPWRDAFRRFVRERGRASLDPIADARAFGIGVRVTRGLGVGMALEMRSDDDARAAADGVRAEIDDALAEPMIALSPLAPALRRVDLEPQGRDLVSTVELSPSQVDDLVELIEDLVERDDEQALAPPTPDEVLRPD